MIDYKTMYIKLFNAVTDAINCIQQGSCGTAKEILMQAQQDTEEFYICGEE